MTLTAGTVLGYANVRNLYWDEELIYNPAQVPHLLAEHVDVGARIITYERIQFSYPTFLWTSIFVVKFAYLAFFRRLIDRIPPLIKYWRVVVGISIVSFSICIISVYETCLKWGLEAGKHMSIRLLSTGLILELASCLQPVYFHRALGLAISDIVLDIGTDLLIIAIPLHILWSVRIKPRQKIVLGVFLSLNLFMAIIASIRVSGLNFRGRFDEVWVYFWQQIEACIAVTMISLTAFRSVFVASESSRARRERAMKPWYSSTFATIRRINKPRGSDEESTQGLPSIPSATLTGMRTFIQGGRHVQTSHEIIEELDEWPLCHSRQESKRDTRWRCHTSMGIQWWTSYSSSTKIPVPECVRRNGATSESKISTSISVIQSSLFSPLFSTHSHFLEIQLSGRVQIVHA